MRGAQLLFAMLNESGHLNPTFKLARALRARGHEVRFLATPDVRRLIDGQGFDVEPLYPDLFDEAELAREQALGTLARRRAITARYHALLRRLGSSPPWPSSRAPDLLLVDVTQPQLAFAARASGVRFAYVNTSLPQTRDPGVPPLRSPAAYARTLAERARVELSWRRFLLQRRLSAELAAPLGMCPPYELARRYAAGFGVRARELDCETVYMPQLRSVPELVLCPEAFDFPRAPAPLRTHVESLDLAREEPPLELGALASGLPLVYCALGSQRYRADLVPRFFSRLVSVFRARPGWQLLLATGKHVSASALTRPANVHVVERAPQLALLRRARVMVTHGGLGSVKECIAHGVPMLGVPLDVDQPGNVARVVHHGLGLAVDVAEASERTIEQALARLLDEPTFAQRCGEMRALFEATERAGRGVEAVEALLRSPR